MVLVGLRALSPRAEPTAFVFRRSDPVHDHSRVVGVLFVWKKALPSASSAALSRTWGGSGSSR